MNARIYNMVRFAREYKSSTDREFKEAELKRFLVELFFKPLFEKLLTRDAIWDNTLSASIKKELLQPTDIEEFSILANEVSNQLSHLFSKVLLAKQRTSSHQFDMSLKLAFDKKFSAEKPDDGREVDHYQKSTDDLVKLIFKGIAENNSEGFDLAELNLAENLKHSYSNISDNLSLTLSELTTYKTLLIDMYKRRETLKPFLSKVDTFFDPLCVVSR